MPSIGIKITDIGPDLSMLFITVSEVRFLETVCIP